MRFNNIKVLMFEVKNLQINISGKAILQNISFELNQCMILQIIGRNGVGKTSFLRSLVNLQEIGSGEIIWDKDNIESNNNKYINDLVYLSHKNYLNESLTVLENLEYFYKLFNHKEKYKSDEFKKDLDIILNTIGMSHKKYSPVWKLSQGQRQKVSLARILMANKKLWILDEPFVSLDKDSVMIIWELIKKHLNNKGLVIFTSHQNDYLEDINIDKLNLDNFVVN